MRDHLVAGEDYVRVFLDGVEQHKCVEAHLVEGWIVRAVETDDGHWKLDGDEPVFERVEGVVTALPIEVTE